MTPDQIAAAGQSLQVLTRDGRRVQLEYVKLGRELRTSRQALARFIAAITPAAEQPNQPTPAERQKSAEAAMRGMQAAGA
jgi:hypothetical protein